MGARTLVVQTCSGLSEMATPHPGITVPPTPFPRLYVWDPGSRYACAFASHPANY